MRKSEALLNDAKLGNNIYTRKSSQTNIYLSKGNYRNTEKKSGNNESSKLIKTQERLSAVIICNFGHVALDFLVLLVLILNK